MTEMDFILYSAPEIKRKPSVGVCLATCGFLLAIAFAYVIAVAFGLGYRGYW
jgi:hypothetical protein